METSVPKLQTFFVTEIVRQKRPGKWGTIFEQEGHSSKIVGVKKGTKDTILNSEKYCQGKLIRS